MNYVTEEIMNRYDVSAQTALAIQEIMDRSDLDFSECTDREFFACMNEAFHIYLKENATN